jgi:hypothetical protein
MADTGRRDLDQNLVRLGRVEVDFLDLHRTGFGVGAFGTQFVNNGGFGFHDRMGSRGIFSLVMMARTLSLPARLGKPGRKPNSIGKVP